MRTAVAWLIDALQQRGVTSIATLCGHGLDPLFEAATHAGLRLVDTRNEQTAGYVAEATGRLTRIPGVCASSSGVAVANAMAGVMNAWFDRSPMLYLSGSANLTTLGMGCFQDCDQVGMLAPVTKYSRLVDVPARIVQMLDEAWQLAITPPCGPVHLMLPMDVQRTPIDASQLVRPNTSIVAPGVDEVAVDTAARAIAASRRPLIIAASSIYYASREAASLRTCAERFSIPVQTPIWDRGIFEQPSNVFLGVIGALSADPGLLAKADCILLAGAPADYRLNYLNNVSAPIHRLDHGWYQLPGKLFADGVQPYEDWLDEARSLRSDFSARIENTATRQRVPDRLHALDIVHALGSFVQNEAILIIDGGSIGQWAHHLLTDRRYPGSWLTCGRGGVVGYGIGAAMAARLAYPHRPIVLLSGDGAFTFTVADLECAVRNRLHFTAIVADDQCWGITHSGHIRQFGQGLATELGPIDFPQLARSLGAQGQRIDTAEALLPALQHAAQSQTVTVLHVPISGGNPSV
jgi:acetolactate synthase-1/2/3 large subunit